MKVDVVVVGSGPAGAKTALELAKEGAKVLILEKHKLPRFKLCGGCISSRTASLLPEGWESLVLNRIRAGILGFRGQRFVKRTSSRDIAYIVDRANFDHFLTEEATRKGALLWDENPFSGYEIDGKIKVKTSKGYVEADFLVGADGFYTKVGKQLGYEKRKFFRSVEFWAEGELREEVIIDIGLVSRGYGWVFPKGDRISIGIATTGKENLRKVLTEYIKGHKLLPQMRLESVKGWMIPYITEPSDANLGRGRILLTGDSANLVDPLLGEGIYYALQSGLLCARSILERPNDPVSVYSKYVEKNIVPELVYAGKIADLAYRFQRTAFRMGAGFSLDRFFELLEGKESYKSLYRKGIPEFVLSLLHIENFLHIIIDKILRRR